MYKWCRESTIGKLCYPRSFSPPSFAASHRATTINYQLSSPHVVISANSAQCASRNRQPSTSIRSLPHHDPLVTLDIFPLLYTVRHQLATGGATSPIQIAASATCIPYSRLHHALLLFVRRGHLFAHGGKTGTPLGQRKRPRSPKLLPKEWIANLWR